MTEKTCDTLLQSKVIAIVRDIKSDKIVDLAKALLAGGLCCIEVTYDQSSETGKRDTLRTIATLSERQGDKLCIGAGTVLTVAEVGAAHQAGATYILSPNTDEAVIRETKRLGMVSIPGAFTPSEVVAAHHYGADIVKLFPAGNLGAAYVKAIKAPLRHINVMAVGGITPTNTPEFLAAGAVGVGVGGNLVSPVLVAEGRFDEIASLARQYALAAKG